MAAGASYTDTVTAVVKKVGLLSSTGTMLPIDSLTLLDFIVELESATNLRIDIAEISAESFSSIEAVTAMLEKMAKGAA